MRCKHGTSIHWDWTDCYECVREKEEDDANYAAVEAAEEARKQTEILRRMEAASQAKNSKEQQLESEVAALRAEIERLKRNS